MGKIITRELVGARFSRNNRGHVSGKRQRWMVVRDSCRIAPRCISTSKMLLVDDEYGGVDGRQERHDLEHDVKSAKGDQHLPDTRERNFFHDERGQGIA